MQGSKEVNGGNIMRIPNSFLEPEVRDGFYIPSEIKQAWAATLEVLDEVDKICRKHAIPYFADFGTLLGAVRHGGFIPWDDDLDITMKRSDYEHFMKIAPSELPEGFEIVTYANQLDFRNFLGRVVGKKRMCFEEEHLRRFYGFPYITGVDIFVLDYVSADEEKEQARVKLAKYILAVADGIAEGRIRAEQAEPALQKIEQECKIKLRHRQDVQKLRVELYRQVERLFAIFSETESKELTRMMPDGLIGNTNRFMPKEYYDKQVWLPFENRLLPVPARYDEILRGRFGDYMKLMRDRGAHDYPYFEKQKRDLQAVLDFEMPGYRYSGISKHDSAAGREKSLKKLAVQKYEELVQQTKLIDSAYQKFVAVEGQPTMEGTANEQEEACRKLFAQSQQLAIELGSLIERGKWKNHPLIHLLEEYCEELYLLSEVYAQEHLENLTQLLNKLWGGMQKEILTRKEAVFLPVKASDWEYLQSVWQTAMADESCDVYVIPIPYFYKEYDGALCDMQYEVEQFPENVKVIRYDEFDFELHYPDMIFIQNPYDEFDKTTSVHTFFYSANIRKYTEQLVYIPPFILEEFQKENYREYHNMQYYCTMPGVVNADKVMVQSENMKWLYVEKLTEFAGEETRGLWEEKIFGIGSPKEDITTVDWQAQDGIETDHALRLPPEWYGFIERRDGERKKVVLYYTGLSSFMQYGKQMILKMRQVFQTFMKNREEIVILWRPHVLIETTLEQLDPTLYEEYKKLKQEYVEKKIGILELSADDERVVRICDAYFGDTSPLAQKCRNMGKPIMLQDVEIV